MVDRVARLRRKQLEELEECVVLPGVASWYGERGSNQQPVTPYWPGECTGVTSRLSLSLYPQRWRERGRHWAIGDYSANFGIWAPFGNPIEQWSSDGSLSQYISI